MGAVNQARFQGPKEPLETKGNVKEENEANK